jgi:hypothetical protein
MQTNNLLPPVPPASSTQPRRYHRYRLGVVGALVLTYIVWWVMIVSGGEIIGDIGVAIFFAEIALVFVLDGTGVVTLRGRILTSLPKLAIIVLAVVLSWLSLFWLIPYFIVAALDTRGSAAELKAERAQHIASLEGELGILPPADGVCPNCHKPLQLGAEFCAYCGTPLTPALRLCPVCHARTFPDAQWCPECGAALPPVGASPANTP